MGIIKKICLVGAGRTMEKHLDVLKKFKNIELSGIYNRTNKNAVKLKKKFKIKKIFQSIKEMQNETKSQYVFVVVSPEANFKILNECIKYSWTIFTEKPLGINYYEGNKLIDLILKKNLKFLLE